jgi:AcrR family transcriptional regulator
MAEASPHDPSRDRLLLAALEIFAERGFRDATVRDICARAELNPASVNYYFGSKENLYAEALTFAFRQADERYPLGRALDPDLPAAERLRLFIRNLLQRLLDEGPVGMHGKLFAREIADPTPALDRILAVTIRPRFDLLREIVPRILGADHEAEEVNRCIQSIIGQCLVYRHSRSLIDRLCPDLIDGPEAVERTADFIFRFSLAGLQRLSADKGSPP